MDYVETMAFAGRDTWHGKGNKLSADAPKEKMIVEAGHDWEVEKVPLYYDQISMPSGAAVRVEVPGLYTIRRTDTGMLVGLHTANTNDEEPGFSVGRQFTPLQNRELYAFGDALKVASGNGRAGVLWHTAGSLKGGRRVWAMARTADQFELKRRDGSKQKIDPYLLLANGHTGRDSFVIKYTSVYVECWNTLSYALGRGAAARNEFRIRHTTNLADRVEEAAATLAQAHEWQQANAELSQNFADTPLDETGWAGFLSQILSGLDDEERAKEWVAKTMEKEGRSATMLANKGKELTKLFVQGAGSQGGVDRLDALNAVTEWIDHFKGRAGIEAAESMARSEAQQRRDAAERAIEDAERAIEVGREALDAIIESTQSKAASKAARRAERLGDKALESAWWGSGAELKERAVKLLVARD